MQKVDKPIDSTDKNQDKIVAKNPVQSTQDSNKPEPKKDFWGNLGNVVKKAVDCCLE